MGILRFTACKVKKGEKSGELYTGKWISGDDHSKSGYFRFKIVSDDYYEESDFNNLGGGQGLMLIATKSMFAFGIDDLVYIQDQKYSIAKIDGNRKESAEQEFGFAKFKNTGALTTTLLLRRAG